jgi:hypothetical protein
MKMKFLVFFSLVILIFVSSCGSKSKDDVSVQIEELKEIIKQKEDSLSNFQTSNEPIPQKKHYELIESLLKFYRTFPKDKYAPVCLDKVQMSYSGLGVYFKAVEFADTLIERYPKYINRAMVLESQASNFDIFHEPRDTNKVKYYYGLLLKENPKLDKDKKEGILMRLKHLDLTFDEYISTIMK